MHPCDAPGKADGGAVRSPGLPVIRTASGRFDTGMFYLRASSRVNTAVLRAVAEGPNGLSQ